MFLYWIPFVSLANQDYYIGYLQWSIDNMFLVELDQELMPKWIWVTEHENIMCP